MQYGPTVLDTFGQTGANTIAVLANFSRHAAAARGGVAPSLYIRYASCTVCIRTVYSHRAPCTPASLPTTSTTHTTAATNLSWTCGSPMALPSCARQVWCMQYVHSLRVHGRYGACSMCTPFVCTAGTVHAVCALPSCARQVRCMQYVHSLRVHGRYGACSMCTPFVCTAGMVHAVCALPSCARQVWSLRECTAQSQHLPPLYGRHRLAQGGG
jgi:hypothetical protein